MESVTGTFWHFKHHKFESACLFLPSFFPLFCQSHPWACSHFPDPKSQGTLLLQVLLRPDDGYPLKVCPPVFPVPAWLLGPIVHYCVSLFLFVCLFVFPNCCPALPLCFGNTLCLPISVPLFLVCLPLLSTHPSSAHFFRCSSGSHSWK